MHSQFYWLRCFDENLNVSAEIVTLVPRHAVNNFSKRCGGSRNPEPL